MINETKLKNFLSKYLAIKDEMANQQMNDELDKVFEEE